MSEVKIAFDGDVGGIVDRIAKGLSGGTATALLKAAAYAAGELRRTSQMLTKSGKQKGGLARSWKEQLNEVSGDTLSVGAYSAMPYAQIQNEGGIIRAKRKFLAIPLNGVPRGKWPRDYPRGELFRPMGRDGKPRTVLAMKTGQRGKLKILFALTPSVRIDATGYIDFAAESAAPKIEEIIGNLAQRAIEEA
jgi:hypothetical protein